MKNSLAMIAILLVSVCFGQGMDDFVERSLKSIDLSKNIPSLDSLKTLARQNSPLMGFHDADIAYTENQVQLAKKRWMDFIYLDGSYNYGIFDNITNQQLSGLPSNNQTLISTEASRYTLGASLKVPISAIFNRKNNVQAEKALRERAQYSKEATFNDIERQLILNYNDVLRSHKLMFLAENILETYRVQSLRAKADYENGIIELSDYTRLQQQMNQSYKEFERQKSEFLLMFMYLENTVGTKIELQQ